MGRLGRSIVLRAEVPELMQGALSPVGLPYWNALAAWLNDDGNLQYLCIAVMILLVILFPQSDCSDTKQSDYCFLGSNIPFVQA